MTNLQTQTLRPGLLVSLKTSVSGNVSYEKTGKTVERTESGSVREEWETKKNVANADELERASKARGKARSLIGRVCAKTAFGYLCPEADAEMLNAALADARKIVEEFNAGATVTRVYFYSITGRVAPDDVEAVRAINSEIRSLLEDMQAGIRGCDVKAIRKAADEARQLGQMLNPDAQARIGAAIKAARDVATKMNAAGEQAAAEVDQRALRMLTEARTAFLDIEQANGEIAAPFEIGRAIDLTPSDEQPKALAAAPARELEI